MSGNIAIQVELRQGAFMLSADLLLPGAGVAVLFGPSGAGKTSLINCVAGLVRPQRGRIAIGDRVLFDSQTHIDLPPERRHVGYVFQDGRLFPHLSVAANLRYGMKPGSGARGFDEVVELLGIAALLPRRPANLSGGEKQRVAIGRALLSSPQLLLMDEPLASLDQARRAEILPYLERLRDRFGLPILYVTHDRTEARRLATQVVLVKRGGIAAQGRPDQVLPILPVDQESPE